MARSASIETIAGISSDAVKAATGRAWDEWLTLLDRAGAASMSHKDIAQLLSSRWSVRPWWGQMVTVGYEQARGLREKHETAKGFQVGVSKTYAVPVAALYRAWADARTRARWLKAKVLIRKATPNKSMRITWSDATTVEVNFWVKGAGRSQAQVQHNKLTNRADVERRREFWREALDALSAVVSPPGVLARRASRAALTTRTNLKTKSAPRTKARGAERKRVRP